MHGELLLLGVKVAASTVWEISKEAGIDPAPERGSSTWADFLRSPADALLACDFFEAVTLTGARLHVPAVLEPAGWRVRLLGATAHPTAAGVAQAVKNLVMELADGGCQARFPIRDRDGRFPDLFNGILKGAGIQVVLSGVRMPGMNAVMERWAQTCRRELLGRTLMENQRHLLHALRETRPANMTVPPERPRAVAAPSGARLRPAVLPRDPASQHDSAARTAEGRCRTKRRAVAACRSAASVCRTCRPAPGWEHGARVGFEHADRVGCRESWSDRGRPTGARAAYRALAGAW